MATLTETISATDRELRITDPGNPEPGIRFRLGDELLDLSGFAPYALVNGYRPEGLDHSRWFVNRGVGQSTAASHDAGTTLMAAVSASVSAENLTPPSPFAGAGGAEAHAASHEDGGADEIDLTGLTGSGGLDVLGDPGEVWEPSHAYLVGDRFAETVAGAVRVFEITVAGTSGAGVFSDYEPFDLTPLGTWGTNAETFQYIGIVGQLPWTVAPFLGGGLTLGPRQDNGYGLVYQSQGEPGDVEQLLLVQATFEGGPVDVMVLRTDGDADYKLDSNTGASIKWHNSVDGSNEDTTMVLATDQFTVGLGAGFTAYFNDSVEIFGPAIKFIGATAAPIDAVIQNSSFALWLDPTPGSAKLMVKAKQSDGTVVTADVAVGPNGIPPTNVIDAQALHLSGSNTLLINSPKIRFAGATAVPADVDIGDSSFALWLDATPGGTKLMVKAKDSGGTVRTGEIPLA